MENFGFLRSEGARRVAVKRDLNFLVDRAEDTVMDITSSTSVGAATAAAQGDAADAVNILVLKKALNTQAAGALSLINAIPRQPALATEGTSGRNVNAYA
jgi:hypothetical protein